MRALAIVVCLVVCAGRGTADEPRADASRIRAKLASEDPKDVAWGLHDAIEGRVAGLDDSIRDALTHLPWQGGDRLRSLAIDAVIELDVALPDDALHALAKGSDPARSLILAARKPESFRDRLRVLLATVRDDDAWIAATNLLLPTRDPVLAAGLLGQLRFEATLEVSDSGEYDFGGSLGSFGGGWACAQSRDDLKGWPPRAWWELGNTAEIGLRVVASGPTSIYAERREAVDHGFICSRMPRREARGRYATEALAVLLRCRANTLQSSLTEHRWVRFVDADTWTKDIDGVQRTLLLRWLAIAHACWREGLLSPGALAGLTPRVSITVRDLRASKSPPLPPIPSPAAPSR